VEEEKRWVPVNSVHLENSHQNGRGGSFTSVVVWRHAEVTDEIQRYFYKTKQEDAAAMAKSLSALPAF